MSRIFLFLVLFALALPSFAQKPGQIKTLHFDLTKMSGTVVFAMVNRMVTEPVKFQGKRIKMGGGFPIIRNADMQTK